MRAYVLAPAQIPKWLAHVLAPARIPKSPATATCAPVHSEREFPNKGARTRERVYTMVGLVCQVFFQ